MVHGYDQYVSYGYPGGLDRIKDIVGKRSPSKGRPKRPIFWWNPTSMVPSVVGR